MSSLASYPFCIACIVTPKAIEALLEGIAEQNSSAGSPSQITEDGTENQNKAATSARGSYRDTHPWLIAQEMLAAAVACDQQLPLLIACKDGTEPAFFSHWAMVSDIEVVELHRGQWESRCQFVGLEAFNPIWTDIDSVYVKPSFEQLERERRENIRVYRDALDEHHIHPYAVCETPDFILLKP